MLPIEKVVSKLTKSVTNDEVKVPTKVLYVGPMPDTLPDDGVLTYQQVGSVYDFKSVSDRVVCLFDETALPVLKCAVEYPELFGVELITMLGVPKAEYGPKFDEIVWKLDRVAYAAFVSELALAMESRANVDAANATQHDRERATYVRNNGTVKQHNSLVLAEDSDQLEDDSELED